MRWSNTSLVVALIAAAAGRADAACPDDLAELAVGHWCEVNDSHMRQVAFHWSDGPPTYNGGDVRAVMSNWSGGAFDTHRDQLIIWGGGHKAYGGNEIYVFDVGTKSWSLAIEPSIPWADSVPYAPDGHPVARHTYNMVQYVPTIDRFCSFGGRGWFSEGSGGGVQSDCFDPGSASWERIQDAPGSGWSSVTAFDSSTGLIWLAVNNSGGSKFGSWEPVSDQWTVRNPSPGGIGLDQTAAIDPGRGVMVSAGGGRVYAWNLRASGTITKESVTTGGATAALQERNGFEYHPPTDRFVLWNGGADVFTLDWDTKTWTRVVPAPANTVTPGSPAGNGTYGRFRHVPSKDVFVLVNSVDQNVFFYRLTNRFDSTKPAPPHHLLVY